MTPKVHATAQSLEQGNHAEGIGLRGPMLLTQDT